MSTTSVTLRRLLRLTPSRTDLVDGGFLVGLAVLALIGFRTTYDGWSYLVVGVIGLALGVLIAHLANVLRQPVIVLAAMTIGVFFLLGGAIALPGQALADVLPTAGSVRGLADTSVHGWKDLLTTLPPVDGSGPLLVLPYLLGLLGGAGGFCLARRLRASMVPLAAPVAMLVVVILLGTNVPAARLPQGVVFAVLALCWAAERARRQRPAIRNGTGQVARVATAGVLLTVAAAGAIAIGPSLADSQPRTVLRSHITPPFNARDYPSPLAGFRKYVKGSPRSLYDTPLFRETGLPAGNQIRIAVLSTYDGAVWAAGPDADPADTFQRVGRTIAQRATGQQVSFVVTVEQYSDVWLPDAGTVTGVAFGGPDAAAHAGAFRYNLATGTGIVPDRLQAGDSYTIRAVLPAAGRRRPLADDPTVDATAVPPVKAKAARWAGPSTDPWARIGAVAAALKEGAYSDGVDPAEQQYVPGHGAWRLTNFLDAPQLVGDDEQYAAAFALLVNQLGYPARVVLGAVPEADGVVRGRDVHAWVEVRTVDGSWQPIYSSSFMPDKSKKPNKQQPPQEQRANGVVVPPPVTQRPPNSVLVGSQADSHVTGQVPQPGTGFHLPGWLIAVASWAGPPVLAVLAWSLTIIGLKSWRRRLRRARGPVPTRIGRGWREVMDHARDLGAVVPAGLTRREQAAALAQPDVVALAWAADAGVFGPGDPSTELAVAYWRDVESVRRQMSHRVSRLRRFRAAISLASLRPASLRLVLQPVRAAKGARA